MDKFIINGGIPLHGEVTPGGNKNAALPLLSACLLSEEPVTLRNVPDIKDVQIMGELIQSLGVEIKKLEATTWQIHAKEIHPTDLDPDLCRKIRASILLAGPVVAKTGNLQLPPPGGDVIGRRRVDTHLLALEKLGAEVHYDRAFKFKAKGLKGADILLDETSVTATENAIMASVLARGMSIIRNAASEPHVQDLCHLLNAMGAKISNIGSNTLNIEGVPALHGADFEIGPDYLEVISFVGAAAVTRGEITIKNAGVQYLDMIRLVFKRLGVVWEERGNDLYVPSNQKLMIEPDLGGAIPTINVMPWPAFPTDLMSIAIVTATQSQGTVLFHDWMYPSRMFFTDKLVAMGAQIVLCDPHRCIVQGPTPLAGEKMESPDIRAGMALVLASLSAHGQSIIRNVNQIDRGYEKVEEKLRNLGADIIRTTEE
ncbi:MAG TPA: UDP-N-acetylglucosamine 1-carboxyvinyltransferase [Anaerolineaceae bacterium]|jgi:UDP-N-acetylglucosamine 1-carboxyvinyltransferase|nr:UDP-N-acetylglucosamine 1-carboxyvinyltransferase [Chloroflexota bacterium]HNW14108.1 UDP-N-acetylglucosamine 1-carboxyvinyltransferase [Anaerolineaceae bacterium]HOE02725.1 UDP-N-acetylglucosamine 1-carboxyvinyltransferase [Anaerolineaceae bacterium]HUM63565.1 UDP-N-acetylglucosamine 1-carboxyvinyltransferase [Anaerolineaceae bacterium]